MRAAASGGARWRAEVPGADPALVHGFVALGDRRVVLAAHDGTLRAWDAATGTPVG